MSNVRQVRVRFRHDGVKYAGNRISAGRNIGRCIKIESRNPATGDRRTGVVRKIDRERNERLSRVAADAILEAEVVKACLAGQSLDNGRSTVYEAVVVYDEIAENRSGNRR